MSEKAIPTEADPDVYEIEEVYGNRKRKAHIYQSAGGMWEFWTQPYNEPDTWEALLVGRDMNELAELISNLLDKTNEIMFSSETSQKFREQAKFGFKHNLPSGRIEAQKEMSPEEIPDVLRQFSEKLPQIKEYLEKH